MTRAPCDAAGWGSEQDTIYGDLHRIAVCHARLQTAPSADPDQAIEIKRCLERLAEEDPRKARVVENALGSGTTDRFTLRELEDALHPAIALSPTDRRRFLDRACGPHHASRERGRMLEADSRASDIFDHRQSGNASATDDRTSIGPCV